MNKPLILHTARSTGIPWEILKSVVPEGFEVMTLDELSYDCLVREAVEADYLLVSGRLLIDEGMLSAATHLKMIQRTGVGTEMLDVEAIKQRGIPVYMFPEVIVHLKAMPFNMNGKIDRIELKKMYEDAR